MFLFGHVIFRASLSHEPGFRVSPNLDTITHGDYVGYVLGCSGISESTETAMIFEV